jgi:hypothetical protein
MTPLEKAIREVSDLRDFYERIQMTKKGKKKIVTARRSSRPAKPGTGRRGRVDS